MPSSSPVAPDAATAKRIDTLKAEVRRETRPAKPKPPRRYRLPPLDRALAAHVLRAALRVAVILVLPFVVLVRGAVFFHVHGQAPTWLALLVAGLLTVGVVTAYAAWLSHQITGRARFLMLGKWVALPLVVFYCGYSLVYLSRVNAKPEVRAYYTSVHPLLRLALSTWILVDPGIVVTDMRREPADYGRMGLPVNDRTRHYRQADGWVHAVDLRTAHRGWLKNRLVQVYFWAMGFDTLRHVGTADHLHVELN